MRHVACWTIVTLTLALASSNALAADGKEVALFNGKNLDGWDYRLVDPNVKMADVWRVEDGILICKGEPLGYLMTKGSYRNFKLVVEWRWAPGKEPTNSGVFLRISSEPIKFMPKCIESQLMHGNVGDIWGFRGFPVSGPAERIQKVENHKDLGNFSGVGKIKDAEKKPGEWNTYTITLVGDKLAIELNGEKVNEATGCEVVSGPIGLQSEGGEIHFRSVKLTPMAD